MGKKSQAQDKAYFKAVLTEDNIHTLESAIKASREFLNDMAYAEKLLQQISVQEQTIARLKEVIEENRKSVRDLNIEIEYTKREVINQKDMYLKAYKENTKLRDENKDLKKKLAVHDPVVVAAMDKANTMTTESVRQVLGLDKTSEASVD